MESGPDTQHPGTCAAYQVWREANEGGDALAEDYMAGLGADRLRCPGCRREFAKDDGCNHITCPCGTHYCSECGGVISATRPYDHFNAGRPTARAPPCRLFPGQ